VEDTQAKLEGTAWGRGLISGFIAVTVAAVVLTNLPNSAVKRATDAVVVPYVNATGLGQNWGVFSPDPRRFSVTVAARITYDDGATETWQVPDHGPWLGTYRRYRWRKWMDLVRLDANGGIWEATADWLARTHEASGRAVVQVTLIRRWYDTPPPGAADARPEWNEYEFFVLDRGSG
jgi:hypothetical protein